METVKIRISMVSDDPRDLLVQYELQEIAEMLDAYSPDIEHLPKAPIPGVPKSPEIELAVGAVHLALPAGLLASVIASFIKNYFEARRNRRIRIEKQDGTAIEVVAYSEEETKNIIKILLGSKDKRDK